MDTIVKKRDRNQFEVMEDRGRKGRTNFRRSQLYEDDGREAWEVYVEQCSVDKSTLRPRQIDI